MSQLTELSIPRNMSVPARVSLRAEHLPTEAREALTRLKTTIAEKATAERAFADATGPGKATAQSAVGTATDAVHAALANLGDVTASSTTAIKDSANAAFVTSMETASGSVRAAVDALADAADAAALYATAKPGRPVLRLDGRGPTDAPVRARLGLLRSQLRELLSLLPDDIDG